MNKTPAIPQSMIDRYKNGESFVKLAFECGTYPAKFRAVLVANGVAIRKQGGGCDPIHAGRDAVMTALYYGGQTLEEIGQKYGITRERVRQILRANGIESLGLREQHKPKPAPITAEEQEYARLYESGVPPKELAALFPSFNHSAIINRVGLEVKGTGFWLQRQDDAWRTYEATRLWLSGKGAADIRTAIGVAHVETVYRYLDKGNVAKGQSHKRGSRPRRLVGPMPPKVDKPERGEPIVLKRKPSPAKKTKRLEINGPALIQGSKVTPLRFVPMRVSFIDRESDAGSYADALAHSVNITQSDFVNHSSKLTHKS